MRNNSCKGFTLIEVLIALAILSIALTAIIKATAQNINDTRYLQDKMIANWVAMEVLNESRAGIYKLPNKPEKLEQDTSMLSENWSWQAYLSATPNAKIKQVHVKVFRKSDNVKMASLMSYVNVK
jgi:general secretion pathway protein I